MNVQLFFVASNHSRDSKGNAPTDVLPHRSSWMCLRLMFSCFLVFFHGKSPFNTTIWRILFCFLPGICAANPSLESIRNAPSAFQPKMARGIKTHVVPCYDFLVSY